MDGALVSLAASGATQPCCTSKHSVPGDPRQEGKPTSSSPESGKLAREAVSQAPGPVLLTFSHPTPPRSCLHFRPEAVGSAKRLELALLERCRTPTPLPPHHPFKSHQEGICGKGFSHCPPPGPPKGHHPCEYTPVQASLFQSLHASVSTATQQCHMMGAPKGTVDPSCCQGQSARSKHLCRTSPHTPPK